MSRIEASFHLPRFWYGPSLLDVVDFRKLTTEEYPSASYTGVRRDLDLWLEAQGQCLLPGSDFSVSFKSDFTTEKKHFPELQRFPYQWHLDIDDGPPQEQHMNNIWSNCVGTEFAAMNFVCEDPDVISSSIDHDTDIPADEMFSAIDSRFPRDWLEIAGGLAEDTSDGQQTTCLLRRAGITVENLVIVQVLPNVIASGPSDTMLHRAAEFHHSHPDIRTWAYWVSERVL